METVCPYCDHFFEVLDELVGTRTRCDFCHQIFTVDPLMVIDASRVEVPTDMDQAILGA